MNIDNNGQEAKNNKETLITSVKEESLEKNNVEEVEFSSSANNKVHDENNSNKDSVVEASSTEKDYDFQSSNDLLFSQEILDKFTTKAKENNLSKKQAEDILSLWNSLIKSDIEKSKVEATDAENKLRSEWGNEYEINLKNAINTVKKIGGDDLISSLEKKGLGNDVELIKTFHNMSKFVKKDEVKEDKFVGVEATKKPEEIERWNGMPMLHFDM